MTDTPFKHAAVLGSGMAGLVSARVLSELFERVTLIEKDEVPAEPGIRRGVPQGAHFHALIPGGLEIMSELLPGVKEDLRAAGSLLPAPTQFYFYLPQGKSYAMGRYTPEPPPDTGERETYVQTRALLEHTVRKHVEAIDNVHTRYGSKVSGITSSEGRVTGVTFEGGDELAADLVIDALGKGGKTLQWCEELGFARPAEDVVNCDFAYTTTFMRPKDPAAFADVGFFVSAEKTETQPPRGGALVRMEDGTWLASVGGRYGDYPPRDIEGWRAFVNSTGNEHFMRLVASAEPVSELAHFRFPRGVRRRFEQLEAFPEGLLPIGDSICHYNPLYGQGMSAASRQAIALRAALRSAAENGSGLDGLWRRFLPEAYQETRAPWLFACLADFRDERCTGDFPSDEAEALGTFLMVLRSFGTDDTEASEMAMRIASLKGRLDELEQSPWPERFAASQAEAAKS
ncbi:MAG: tryptophan 7-halogenase [Myxococcales bacterium]|nr:tryptophan 7-halogenase [Myxococcales bacterium]